MIRTNSLFKPNSDLHQVLLKRSKNFRSEFGLEGEEKYFRVFMREVYFGVVKSSWKNRGKLFIILADIFEAIFALEMCYKTHINSIYVRYFKICQINRIVFY